MRSKRRARVHMTPGGISPFTPSAARPGQIVPHKPVSRVSGLPNLPSMPVAKRSTAMVTTAAGTAPAVKQSYTPLDFSAAQLGGLDMSMDVKIMVAAGIHVVRAVLTAIEGVLSDGGGDAESAAKAREQLAVLVNELRRNDAVADASIKARFDGGE